MYTIFLLKRGLNYKGVALVDGFYMISSALLDYPSGGLADRYGRGLIAALGCLSLSLGLLYYSVSRSLYQFLFSEFLAAIGTALYSGALIAWLVDLLKKEGRMKELATILGKARLLSLLVSAVGAFIGGVMADYRIELPFVAGAISGFSAFLIALLFARDRGESIETKEQGYIDILRRGMIILIRTKTLIMLTASAFFITLAIPSFNLTWAPYMEELGASKRLLGFTSFLFMITAGLGGYTGGLLTRYLGYRRVVICSLMFMSSSLALLTIVSNLYAFIAIALLYEIGFGAIGPTLNAWINEYVPSRERATVISLRRTLMLPFSALGMAIMGILSDLWSPRIAYLFSSIAVALSLPYILKAQEKKTKDKAK